MGRTIRLYWWSEIFIQKKDKENYGDLLGKYLVEKISGKSIQWVRANRFYIKNLWQPVYVTIGSVLDHIGKHCIVWGSGIISKDAQVPNAEILAVRGPLSRKRLQSLNIDCPEVYGDPALLLPCYYNPEVNKKYLVGVIPHINDYKLVSNLFKAVEQIRVIDFLTNDIEKTTREILECKYIISSSLHGIILAHAYEIPAIQVKFSDTIFVQPYSPLLIDKKYEVEDLQEMIINHSERLPLKEDIIKLQDGLMEVCPFK